MDEPKGQGVQNGASHREERKHKEMTLEEINQMSIGLEMDVLVAERVMGCKVSRDHNNDPYCNCNVSRPHNRYWNEACDDLLADYSESINAAWQVVKKVNPADLVRELHRASGFGGEDGDYLTFVEFFENADKAPLAICQAALKIAFEL